MATGEAGLRGQVAASLAVKKVLQHGGGTAIALLLFSKEEIAKDLENWLQDATLYAVPKVNSNSLDWIVYTCCY